MALCTIVPTLNQMAIDTLAILILGLVEIFPVTLFQSISKYADTGRHLNIDCEASHTLYH